MTTQFGSSTLMSIGEKFLQNFKGTPTRLKILNIFVRANRTEEILSLTNERSERKSLE